MSNVVPLTIESLVAILLLLTILYCVRLNDQLKLLKADGSTMQKTIAELVTGTENAERAIASLKATVREADLSLGESLGLAERYSAELQKNVAAGTELLNRLGQIAEARAPAAGAKATPDPKAIVAAAQAFTERARARAKAIAA